MKSNARALSELLLGDRRFTRALDSHANLPPTITGVAEGAESLATCATPELRRSLTTLARVEADSSLQLSNALHLGVNSLVPIGDFITKWGYEEAEHGRAFFAMASAVTEHPVDRRRDLAAHRAGARLRRSASRHTAYLGSYALPSKYAFYATFGAAQESAVMRAYQLLLDRLPTSESRQVVRQIVAQEASHLNVYRTMALVLLSNSALSRRFVSRLLPAFWKPVGIEAMGAEDFRRLVNFLCGTSARRDILAGSDRAITTLPGMASLSLMADFLDEDASSR